MDLLKDPRLPNWIAIGGAAIVVAGVLLGLHSLDAAPRNSFWFFIQDVGFYLGLGAIVLIVSRGQVGPYRGDHPYVRYALIGGLVAMVIAGLWFTLDADSDTFWVFLNEVIEEPAVLAVALAMFEATQRLAETGEPEARWLEV